MARVEDVDLATQRPVTRANMCAVCSKPLPKSFGVLRREGTRVVAGQVLHVACAPPWARDAPDANINPSAPPPTLVVEVTACDALAERQPGAGDVIDVLRIEVFGSACDELDEAFKSGRRMAFRFTHNGAPVAEIDGHVVSFEVRAAGFGVQTATAEIRGRGVLK